MNTHRPLSTAAALLLGAAAVAISAQIPEQYPRPLLHTPTDHPAAHVILLNVEGLHALDLARFVASHPDSALASLTAHGVTYTDAHSPRPDPLAGLLALTTGGTPISTGIVTQDLFIRTPNTAEPHTLLRVNTIFEVVRAKIGPTAWAGSSTTQTDLLRGPSGTGLTDACPAPTDELRLAAVLRWLDAHNCANQPEPSPALLGMTFTAIAAAQRASGYTATGESTPALTQALTALDAGIAAILATLHAHHLEDSTWLVLASPFGSAPLNNRIHRIPLTRIEATIHAAHPGALAHITGGTSALLWLHDPTQAPAIIATLIQHSTALGIADIYPADRLTLTLNPPSQDARMPDILLTAAPGTLWLAPNDTSRTATGGLSDADTHVALLVSGAHLTARLDKTPVPITQLAPLLLRAFGMEKFDLEALHQEHTPALPGIF